jgi:hypothetical protein
VSSDVLLFLTIRRLEEPSSLSKELENYETDGNWAEDLRERSSQGCEVKELENYETDRSRVVVEFGS